MKSKPYLLMFFFALIGGIVLLAFAHNPGIGKSVVMAIGVLSVIASAYTLLLAAFSRNRQGNATKEDEAATVKTSLLIPAVAGLVFGLILVCMPEFFSRFLVYTYGVLFLICGFTQLMFITSKMGTYHISKGFMIVPLLIVGAGILLLVFWHNQEPDSTMTLVTGIVLICFGVNGFAGAAHRKGKIRLYEYEQTHNTIAESAPDTKETEH